MRLTLWLIIGILAALYGVVAYITLDRRDDQAQLDSLLTRTAEAVRKHDLSGTVACVSANYKDSSGMNYDRLRMVTNQALQSEKEFTLEYVVKNTRITGDNASIDMALTVKAASSGFIIFKRDITVCLTKESARHALIIPTKVWRVTRIDNLGLDM